VPQTDGTRGEVFAALPTLSPAGKITGYNQHGEECALRPASPLHELAASPQANA
jgi:hypothetical protein